MSYREPEPARMLAVAEEARVTAEAAAIDEAAVERALRPGTAFHLARVSGAVITVVAWTLGGAVFGVALGGLLAGSYGELFGGLIGLTVGFVGGLVAGIGLLLRTYR